MTNQKTLGGIHTIEELVWAQENDPGLVDECLAQVSILPDLEKYLKWLHDNQVTTKVVSNLRRRKKRGLGIHPSSVCKRPVCLKKIYLECTGETEPLREYDQRSQMTFDIGTLLHDTMQGWLKEMFENQLEVEKSLVNEDLHIVGHADGLFSFPQTRFVLELKSIKEGGNYGWEKVQLKPMEDNVRQAHIYMYVENVPFANVFYMGKNNSDFKEHPLVFNPQIWAELEQDIVQVVKAAYEDHQPAVASPGYHCKYCDFLHACAEGRGQNAKGTRTSRVGRSGRIR